MRTRCDRLACCMLLVLVTGAADCATAAEGQGNWRIDYRAAVEEASQRNLPMLLHFYADWCGPCRRMDREVLHSRELLDQFESGIVGIKINSDRYPQLVRQYGIRALPSDVYLAPDGTVISRSEGYQSRSSYLRKVSIVRASYAPRPKTEIAATENDSEKPGQTEGNPGDDLNLDELTPIDSVPVERPTELVGLDSYSPVSLWNWRQWRKGKPQFRAEFQGVTYYLVDAEELAQFEREPRKFAPQLLGCDPVILADTDRAIAGSTQYGAYFDGHLYLFESAENRNRFKQSPLQYSRTRHAIKLDDIGGAVLR